MSDNEWTAEPTDTPATPTGKPWNAETLMQIAAVRPDLIQSMHAVLKPEAEQTAAAPERLSYHDVYVTTELVPRTSLFNLPYNIELRCTRIAGWELIENTCGVTKQPTEARILGSEYGADAGLTIDVAGTTILDCLGRIKLTAASAAKATAAVLKQQTEIDPRRHRELHANTSLHLCMTKIRQAVAVGWNMVMVPVLEHQYDATVAELTALGYTVTSSQSNNIDKRRWTRIVW